MLGARKWEVTHSNRLMPNANYDPGLTSHLGAGLPGRCGAGRARILEWVAIPFSRDLPDPGIEPESPVLHQGASRAAPGTSGVHAHGEGAVSHFRMERGTSVEML